MPTGSLTTRYIDWADVTNKYMDAAKQGGADELKPAYIAAAEDEIDAALAPLYSVPFTPCPGVVRDLCIDLAYWKIIWRQEGAQTLKDYIDDRLERLLNGGLTITVSGAVLGTGNGAIVNYALDCEDPSRDSLSSGTDVEESRRAP